MGDKQRMPGRIIVELEGLATDHGDVRLGALIDKLDSIKRALSYAEKHAAVHGQRMAVYYRLVDLHHSLPTMAFEPVWFGPPDQDRTNALIYEFRERLRQIDIARVPEEVPADELEAYRQIAPDPEKLRRVNFTFDAPTILKEVERYEVTEDFSNVVEGLLGPEEVAWGTMTGMLEALNLHERNIFYLYPAIGPRSVKCTFDRELRPVVRDAVEHYVEVAGKIHYRKRYQFPQTITGVYRITTLDTDPHRPKLSDLRGIAPSALEFDDAEGVDEEW